VVVTRRLGDLACGVDVGGPRKGFDLAVLRRHRHADRWELVFLERVPQAQQVVRRLGQCGGPRSILAVGVDAPESPAAPSERRRPSELLVHRTICGIRWTPDEAAMATNPAYYGWLRQGFQLWATLRRASYLGDQVVEVFPTAAWTRWCGPRGNRSRAAWSTQGLAGLPIDGLPARTNQDQRDALAAALVAGTFALAGCPHGPTWPIVIP
jgi:predicted nuclease with RNAse H fold